jgi:hypothetical protein
MKRYSRSEERKTLQEAKKNAEQDLDISQKIIRHSQRLLSPSAISAIINVFWPEENETDISLPLIKPVALINFALN